MRGPTNRYQLRLTLGAMALLAALASACGEQQPTPTEAAVATPVPTETLTPTPEPPPDLAISGVTASMQGYTEGCAVEMAPLVTTICVQNQGQGQAGPFMVWALRYGGGVSEWEVEGLAGGEERCLEDESATYVAATVDLDDAVAESDETNNALAIPIPTPPRICTPTPTPTATPVLVSLPPTTTPFPEDAKLRTEVFPIYYCRFLNTHDRWGRGIYEWYRVEVTYLKERGEWHPVKEEVVSGPYQGLWQGGCPSKDQHLGETDDEEWCRQEYCGTP